MYDDAESGRDEPEPAQKFLYHATGKLYRYLARFAGEDPDKIEQAVHDSLGEVTAGADPVLIGDAIGDGINLGFSLAERRRALRRYHEEMVRRELAPPAYDSELVEGEDGELAGRRVLVSEPDCRFFTSAVDEPELLVRTPDGGEVGVPLEFEPGAVEPFETNETVSEVIVRPADWSAPDAGDDAPEPSEDESAGDDADEDGPVDALEGEYLAVAREVVLEDPGRALLADEQGGSHTNQLVAALLERKPSVTVEEAPGMIHDAIRRVGLDKLEERYDELIEDDEEDDIDEDGLPDELAEEVVDEVAEEFIDLIEEDGEDTMEAMDEPGDGEVNREDDR